MQYFLWILPNAPENNKETETKIISLNDLKVLDLHRYLKKNQTSTLKLLKLFHLLLIPYSSTCALQGLPNHHCAETISHIAVETLTSQSTTYFNGKQRGQNSVYPAQISTETEKKEMCVCACVKIIFSICFLLNLRQKKPTQTRNLKYRSTA